MPNFIISYFVDIIPSDLVHLSCLIEYGNSLPPNTAPAGFCCPACQKSTVIPSSSASGPVAIELRKVLSNVKWARVGLGLPLIEDTCDTSLITQKVNHAPSNHVSDPPQSNGSNYQTKSTPQIPQLIHHTPTISNSDALPVPINSSYMNSMVNNSHETLNHLHQDPPIKTTAFATGSSSRKGHEDKYSESRIPFLLDVDEDKYRTKSAMEFFSRWLRYVHKSTPLPTLFI